MFSYNPPPSLIINVCFFFHVFIYRRKTVTGKTSGLEIGDGGVPLDAFKALIAAELSISPDHQALFLNNRALNVVDGKPQLQDGDLVVVADVSKPASFIMLPYLMNPQQQPSSGGQQPGTSSDSFRDALSDQLRRFLGSSGSFCYSSCVCLTLCNGFYN